MSAPEQVQIGNAELWLGDCREVLPLIETVAAVVTDPPYGLSFMGKRWDSGVPDSGLWALMLERLSPGGHLLAFAGTRTQHRMAVAIEDAGFEIRDMIAWVYGSGFPKSLDVGKAIDKASGVAREVIGSRIKSGIAGKNTFAQDAYTQANRGPIELDITAPATAAARQWDGWGTALKPAFEPITLARKPLVGTVAGNVQEHGTGALNIDGCRVDGGDANPGIKRRETMRRGGRLPDTSRTAAEANRLGKILRRGDAAKAADHRPGETLGRWPANLIHDGSADVVALFPNSNGQSGSVRGTEPSKTGDANCYGDLGRVPFPARGDFGSASRFFYCAKATAAERGADNNHPTVKPLALMRYLITLITPPGGVVLDPFLGSGSTGVAAALLGVRFVGIEREREYFDIACRRIDDAQRQGLLIGYVGAPNAS